MKTLVLLVLSVLSLFYVINFASDLLPVAEPKNKEYKIIKTKDSLLLYSGNQYVGGYTQGEGYKLFNLISNDKNKPR